MSVVLTGKMPVLHYQTIHTMEDILGNAPPTQLLFMLGIICFSAILLMAIMVFSVTRRGESSSPKPNLSKPATLPIQPPDDEEKLDISILSRFKSTPPIQPEPVVTAKPEIIAPPQISLPPKEIKSTPMQTPKIDLVAPPEPAQLTDLLHLWRDPTGQLVVEIAGQRYTKLTEVTDKHIGQYILRLVAHLLAFTNGVIVTEAGLKSVYVPKIGEVPLPPFSAATVTKTAQMAIPPTPRLIAIPVPIETVDPVTAPALSGFNLADQINKFVQAHLALSPLAATTKIKIFSTFKGGIQIEVNGERYSSPDEVPQPAVKNLIKTAIQEWEKS